MPRRLPEVRLNQDAPPQLDAGTVVRGSGRSAVGGGRCDEGMEAACDPRRCRLRSDRRRAIVHSPAQAAQPPRLGNLGARKISHGTRPTSARWVACTRSSAEAHAAPTAPGEVAWHFLLPQSILRDPSPTNVFNTLTVTFQSFGSMPERSDRLRSAKQCPRLRGHTHRCPYTAGSGPSDGRQRPTLSSDDAEFNLSRTPARPPTTTTTSAPSTAASTTTTAASTRADHGGVHDDGGVHDAHGGVHDDHGGVHDDHGGVHDDHGGVHDDHGGVHDDHGGVRRRPRLRPPLR